jgi:predicted alpha-1,6-mannanase (GH76 family)
VSYGGRVVEGVHHVQTVNSYHERLQSWMRVAEWYKGDLKPEHFVISGLGRQLINTQLGRDPTRHRHFFPDGRGTGPLGLALSAFDNAVAAAESRSTADLYAALSSRRSTDSTITMSLPSSTS